ncbi:MAG TPA: YciI family protein [Solirubrobacteraceae bacterium]|jgi:hypothetical protein|nr:YciI family protein [Solirubrobacteraceae bacterium]
MKFMMLIYDNPGTRELFQSGEGKHLRDEALSIMAELTESGELLSTEGLADPVNTYSLRIENGAPVVTDAPLAESKEFFGGYLRLDVDSLERALAIAKRWPSLPYGAVEVRPIMFAGGTEL